MKYKFIADLKISNSARYKLSNSLDRIVEGYSDALYTPLGKTHKPESILKGFDEIFDKRKSVLNNDLIENELEERGKFGLRSIAQPWELRKPSILNYFTPDIGGQPLKCEPQSSTDKSILRPVSFEKALNFLKNSTSAGLPFISSKGSVKDEYRVNFLDYFARNDPALLGTRTQEKGKTARSFWIISMATVIFEMMYYRPLLEYQKKQVWRPSLLGPDVVDQHVSQLILEAVERERLIFSSDFKQYDATAKKTLQKGGFGYVKYLYQAKEHDNIDLIANRFLNVGLVTPDGIMKGEHGIPSGSVFTNEIGSTIQFLVARESKVVFAEEIKCQGDDGILSIKSDNVEHLINTYSKRGLEIERKKTLVRKDFGMFCRKMYHIDYAEGGKIGGIYSVYRALNRLVHPERWVNFEDFKIEGKDYYSIRAITILENCKHHPLFEDLVKYTLALDKYKLKYSENGLKQYVSMLNETKGVSDTVVNQYGEDLKGISNFETVKLLKQLVQ